MTMATSLSTLNLLPSLEKHTSRYLGFRSSNPSVTQLRSRYRCDQQAVISSSRLVVRAASEGSAKSSQSDEKIPPWARPDSDEPPPWAQDSGNGSSQSTFELPFYAYLLASALTAIAAIGSIFEYVNQNPIFGIIYSDNVFYVPVLGFFAFTGIPTSAFLWYKSVQVANKEAEEQDRRDGYR